MERIWKLPLCHCFWSMLNQYTHRWKVRVVEFEAEDRSNWYCLVRSGCTGYSLIGWRGYTGPGGLHQLHRARLVKGAATRWNGQTDPPLAPRQATSRNGPAGKCWQISEGKQSGQIHVDKEAFLGQWQFIRHSNWFQSIIWPADIANVETHGVVIIHSVMSFLILLNLDNQTKESV